MKKITLLFCAVVLFGNSFTAAADMYGLKEEESAIILQAFNALFNENFEETDKILAPLQSRTAKSPLIQTAFVVRFWWEMASQVLETEPEAHKPFVDAAEKCIKLSERASPMKNSNVPVLLSLATTLGLMSRWSAANRAFMPAYFRGNKAGEYARRALKTQPKAYDAYMTLGAFIYGKEKIRQYLSKSEQDANPSDPTPSLEGITQLRKAYEEGVYFKIPAGLLLAGILTNEKPEEALPLLSQLRTDLPQSGFVHVLLITALYNVGHGEEMKKEIEKFQDLVKEGKYPTRYKPHGHFMEGLYYFRQKEWRPAEQSFKVAASMDDKKNAYVIWAHLYRGYSLDGMKRREAAKAEYKKVLDLPRRFASHDHARERLEKPFKPSTAPELKKLEL